MKKIKNIKLIGLGAMGCFFAPRLFEYADDNFSVIASGERKKKLEEKGVTINDINYKFRISDPEENSNELDKTDLIIISVKGYSIDEAIRDICPFVGPNTLIMSVLNGVDSEEKLIKAYGAEKVLYSYMRVSIVMKDGITAFNPEAGKVHFGDKINTKEAYSERVLAVKEVLDSAQIPYTIDEDMLRGIWFKFACNVGENMTCAMLGIPFGAFKVSENANFIRESGMREVIKIANKKGIALSEEDVIKQRETLMGLPSQNKPSTLQDLEAGKKTEVDMFAGEVIRLGKELGIATPYSEMFYHSIRVHEEENDRLF